ncbi:MULTISPECIES: hypothetical protein [unclassified Pseudomonas]|uniref:hypothetical protein n=1 Tax=unclassified Pseudomonas TaxID=196821 RepID=UPI0035C216F2
MIIALRFKPKITASMLSVTLLSGCATPINPKDLKEPQEVTCIDLKEPLVLTDHYGPFDMQWTTKFEKGPYWSEKIDPNGTYYRAPPGGISVTDESGGAFPGQPTTSDGGFYIPNKENEPVKLYAYFSTEPAPVQPYPTGTDCTTLGYVSDPSTSKVDIVSFAVGGAIGGATGGLIARGVSSSGNMSYGQAAGAGAAGGLIGGIIIASIINSGIGKMVLLQPPIKSTQYLEKFTKLSSTKAVIRETKSLALNPNEN